jgi:hypothetical protein
MLKLLIGLLLGVVAIAVYVIGREALLVVIGVGAGVGLAELVDLGVRVAARSFQMADEPDVAPARR